MGPLTPNGRGPRVADGRSHQVWWGGPNSYGNKDPWTNRKGNKMGHPQELAHPSEWSPLPWAPGPTDPVGSTWIRVPAQGYGGVDRAS
jgi:hypothetical protein